MRRQSWIGTPAFEAHLGQAVLGNRPLDISTKVARLVSSVAWPFLSSPSADQVAGSRLGLRTSLSRVHNASVWSTVKVGQEAFMSHETTMFLGRKLAALLRRVSKLGRCQLVTASKSNDSCRCCASPLDSLASTALFGSSATMAGTFRTA